jgi:hypothetical protein
VCPARQSRLAGSGGATSGRSGRRHARRPACAPSATYAAEPYEEQLARVFDGVQLTEVDIEQVLAAMRRVEPVAPAADPVDVETARAELQRQLAAGELTIDAFSRAWRRRDRPAATAPVLPDELRLRRARKRLAGFGELWRNPAVPDRLREEALHEVFARVDVQGSQLLAVHPQPNENAWLLGLAALPQEQHVGMVGARGIAPPPTTFPSPCGSPSLHSLATWSAAHDATVVPSLRRTRHRP